MCVCLFNFAETASVHFGNQISRKESFIDNYNKNLTQRLFLFLFNDNSVSKMSDVGREWDDQFSKFGERQRCSCLQCNR